MRDIAMFVIVANFQYGESYWTGSVWGARRVAKQYTDLDEARRVRSEIPRPNMRRGEVVWPVVLVESA